MRPNVVTLYTTQGCPDCKAVRAWLEQHGVPFGERDIGRPGVADEAKKRFGVRIAPITVVDERTFFYGTGPWMIPRDAEDTLPAWCASSESNRPCSTPPAWSSAVSPPA